MSDKVPGMTDPLKRLELLSKKPVDEILDEDITQDLVDYELDLWHKNGMDPSNVSHDIFRMDVQLQALIQFISEKFDPDDTQMSVIFKRLMYTKLRKIRDDVTANMIKQQILQGVSLKIPKDILGNNGGASN